MILLSAAIALLLLAALAISYPLFFQRLETYTETEPMPEAYTERDALLEALSDIQLSFDSGKLSPADFERQQRLLQKEYLRLSDAAEG